MRVLTTVLKQTEGMVSLDGILYNEGNYEKKMCIRDSSKEIWYDWMMQYYTSVIIAFYKLKNKYTDIDF